MTKEIISMLAKEYYNKNQIKIKLTPQYGNSSDEYSKYYIACAETDKAYKLLEKATKKYADCGIISTRAYKDQVWLKNEIGEDHGVKESIIFLCPECKYILYAVLNNVEILKGRLGTINEMINNKCPIKILSIEDIEKDAWCQCDTD